MRHRKKKGRLNRRSSWRKATLKSLANDLLTYQRIETTMIKAKALRSFAEPLITLAKNNPESVSARRQAYQKLCDRVVVKSLFDEIGPLYKDVPGGYTRIMALGNRKGDGAAMAIMELTKRTISDDDLLGKTDDKVVKQKKSRDKQTEPEKDQDDVTKKPDETGHVAPEIDKETKEERVIEDVKKEKAKKEQRKITSRGIFKRFRRKSIG